MKTKPLHIGLLITACYLLFIGISSAQSIGELDLTFGNNGIVATAISGKFDEGYSVAIQPDGKIVVAGDFDNGTNHDFAVVRYNIDGTLDHTFSSDGIITTDIGSGNDKGYSVAIQSDGKIVVAGSSFNGSKDDFAVVRYNINGTLDLTFSSDGIVTTDLGGTGDYGRSVVIQPDGKIVVAGISNGNFAVVRYNANGILDNTFSSDGIVTTVLGGAGDYGQSVVIQADGKIVVAGYSYIGVYTAFGLVRYNTDGTLDNTFSSDGIVTTYLGGEGDYGRSVAIQPDGKIIVAGISNGNFAVIRYNIDGTLDLTFSSDGIVTTALGGAGDYGQSVAIQPDGKIVAAGFSYFGSYSAFSLIRYNTDGTIDSTFSSDGSVATDIGSSDDMGYSVALQPDGKIVVAGISSYGSFFSSDSSLITITRYIGNTGTSVEKIEEIGDIKIYPNPATNTLNIELDKNDQTPVIIFLYNALGEIVAKTNNNTNKNIMQIDLSTFSNGLYYLNVQTKDRNVEKKVTLIK